MSKKELEIEDDVLVRRETIMELFNPAPSRSTFFDWASSGRIKKARGLKGFYLLNATRKNLRMPPVDVASFRKQRECASNRQLQLVYVALMVIIPEMTSVINEIELPDALTPAEMMKVKRLIAAHREPALEQKELFFQVVYCRAVLDAELMSQEVGQKVEGGRNV